MHCTWQDLDVTHLPSCSSFLSVVAIKTTNKGSVWREEFIWLAYPSYCPLLKDVMVGTQAGAEMRTIEASPGLLLYKLGSPARGEITRSKMNSSASIINQESVLTDWHISQSDRGIFSLGVPLPV